MFTMFKFTSQLSYIYKFVSLETLTTVILTCHCPKQEHQTNENSLCYTFSPVINSDSNVSGWIKGHTGEGVTGPKQAPTSAYVSASATLPPRLKCPSRPSACHEAGTTWRPIVNPRDKQGVRAGEKQGGKGERAVSVNEGQRLCLYTVVPQSMTGLMALSCEKQPLQCSVLVTAKLLKINRVKWIKKISWTDGAWLNFDLVMGPWG